MDEEPRVELDLGGSIRGAVALEQLLRWVLETNANNELDWLEWKVGLDLTARAHQFAVAKQIIGFANREPSRAAVHAEGCAFIVLGAEPRNLAGQDSIDNADLDAGLRRYLGTTTGPQWTPLWVQVDGVDVLVITVEPPRPGHRKHVLEHAAESFQPGQAFIRRAGGSGMRITGRCWATTQRPTPPTSRRRR